MLFMMSHFGDSRHHALRGRSYSFSVDAVILGHPRAIRGSRPGWYCSRSYRQSHQI